MPDIYHNLIAGEWAPSVDAIDNINPSDQTDIIGRYAQASRAQLYAAVESARKAQKIWQAQGLEKRQAVLNKIGEELIARSTELGTLLAREEGKTRAEAVGEVYRAGQFFTYYAAEILRQTGENADSVRADVEIDIRREPMGLVGVISPWNFPTATASWKIAPALAYGNAVLWKPANLTPASAWALSEIIARQEIPKGLFSLIMGSGSEIGQTLIDCADIDAITFTGSYDIGRVIARAAAENFTKFQLELGSKNALLILDDADLDIAVSAAVSGAFGGTGQKCTASSRLVVHAAIHDQFIERMLAATKNIKVGPALADDTRMGPVASESQLQSNLSYMQIATGEGCELICGGQRLDLAQDGFYMSPAILLNSTNSMRVNREEMFAPATCVIKVDDYEQGLAVVNDTDYGLTAGIVTSSLARATHFRRQAETGCVMVNLPTAGTDYHVPFGGRKNSSFGSREQGKYAREFYTQVKTSYIYAGAIK